MLSLHLKLNTITMIQRIQTLYLTLASVAIALLFAFPLAQFFSENGAYVFSVTGLKNMVPGEPNAFSPVIFLPIIIVAIGIGLLTLYTVFQYKNRSLQIKLTNIGVLASIALIMGVFFLYIPMICLEGGQLVLVQYPFMLRDTRINFFSSNLPVSSFTTDRKRFLGKNEYGTWAAPYSLQEAELDCYETHRGDNVGVLLHHLGTLDPGQSTRLIDQGLHGQRDPLRHARPQPPRSRRAPRCRGPGRSRPAL